jgi:hypothetical protein
MMISTICYLVNNSLVIAAYHFDVPAEQPIHGPISGVHQKGPSAQPMNLFGCAYDGDIILPNPLDHLGADLLISSAKDVSLAADRGHDYPGLTSIQKPD